jgi:hypothetical protein
MLVEAVVAPIPGTQMEQAVQVAEALEFQVALRMPELLILVAVVVVTSIFPVMWVAQAAPESSSSSTHWVLLRS